jgi:hypothetical protein
MRLGLLLLVACDAGVPAKPAPKPTPIEEPIAHEYAECDDRPFAQRGDAASAKYDGVLATLRRHACYGRCPVYQVDVFRDGRVQYTGTQWVAKCAATASLTPFQLGALDYMLSDIFALKDEYLDADWTDASTVDLSYSPEPGKRKVVEHYHGDEGAPKGLSRLEDAFDMIVGTERWVRVEPRE